MMETVIHSERLSLRPYRLSDLDITTELFADARVRQYAGGPMPVAEIRRQMPSWIRRGGGGGIGVWCVTLSATGEKLGTGALLPMPIDSHETDFESLQPGRMPDADIEIGYFLKPSAWGKGYASEVCRRLLRLAFEDLSLNEVVATCDAANAASRKVLLKSGFADEGRRYCYGDENSPFFRITRERWLAGRAAAGRPRA